MSDRKETEAASIADPFTPGFFQGVVLIDPGPQPGGLGEIRGRCRCALRAGHRGECKPSTEQAGGEE